MKMLDEIVANKRREVIENKELYPTKLLEQGLYFKTAPVSLAKYLKRKDKQGIIAEIKRKSPSKGVINSQISVEQLSIGYMQAGASALSILTDSKYFGGSKEDLSTARKFNFCPILRKDFILDPYQITEAKSWGADAILLIARLLSVAEVKNLSNVANDLGLEVLLEVHNQHELDRYNDKITLIGVNNRDLDDLSISLDRSMALIELLPKTVVKIAESGIDSASDVIKLKHAGFDAVLMGERFMKHSRPDQACHSFIQTLCSEMTGADAN